jgi:hypothetical protein
MNIFRPAETAECSIPSKIKIGGKIRRKSYHNISYKNKKTSKGHRSFTRKYRRVH